MKKKIYGLGKGLIAMLAIMCSAQMSNAQVGIGTNVPDPSAQLQIESTSKGLLIPRVTSTDDVTLPAKSLLVYQTGGTAGFYYNSGTPASPEWVKLATGQGGVAGAAGGDLSGTFPNPSVASGAISSDKIADGTITNTDINASAAIAYSKLALTNSVVNGDLTASSVTTSKVADGTVTSAKIFDGTIVNADVSPAAAIAYSKLALTNAIVAGDITSGAVTPAKLSGSGASSGDVLTYNGSNVSWAAPSGVSIPMFSAFIPTLEAATSTQLTGWTTTSPYYNYATFNAVTGNFTVPATGRYQINAVVNYSTTATISVNLGAGIYPSFVVRRTSPATTDLAAGMFPVMDVNIALVLNMRTIMSSAAVPVSATVELSAGDVISLFYEADGLTIPLKIGGDGTQGVNWSITRVQ